MKPERDEDGDSMIDPNTSPEDHDFPGSLKRCKVSTDNRFVSGFTLVNEVSVGTIFRLRQFGSFTKMSRMFTTKMKGTPESSSKILFLSRRVTIPTKVHSQP